MIPVLSCHFALPDPLHYGESICPTRQLQFTTKLKRPNRPNSPILKIRDTFQLPTPNSHPSHLTAAYAASIATNGPPLTQYHRGRSKPPSPTHHNPSSCNLCLYIRVYYLQHHHQIYFHLHISPSTPPPKSPTTSSNNNIVIIIYCASNRNSSSGKYYDTLGPIATIHVSACAARAAECASGRYGEFAAYDSRTGGLSPRPGRVVGRSVSFRNLFLRGFFI